MYKFGSYELPHVLTIQESYPRIRQQVPLPGRSCAYRRDLGGLGAQITLSGEIRENLEQSRDDLAALADGVVRLLDLENETLNAIMLDPTFAWAVEKYGRLPYTLTFLEVNNPT
jgi:hypothetical protein